jgi:hypothetical protein
MFDHRSKPKEISSRTTGFYLFIQPQYHYRDILGFSKISTLMLILQNGLEYNIFKCKTNLKFHEIYITIYIKINTI